jgi:hypothetical protein
MKAAIGAVEMTEETMRLLTRGELMRYTEFQLDEAFRQNTNALFTLPIGSLERQTAENNLDNIRCEQFRRARGPGGRGR